MPATPFHLGPALFVGALLISIADLPTLLLATLIPDVEPGSNFILRFFGFTPPFAYHGSLHTFIGATLLAIAFAFLLVWLSQKYKNRIRLGSYVWRPTKSSIVIASIIGLNLHIFVDSFVNTDMHPFWPYQQNPLLGTIPPLELYIACALLFILGAAILAFRLRGSRFLKSASPK